MSHLPQAVATGRTAPSASDISEFLPPRQRQQLVLAAAVGDLAEVDRITDFLAKTYPELVAPRSADRPQFASRRAALHYLR